VTYTAQQSAELGLLTILVGREARNQAFDAMLGVAWSVRNRVMKPRYWGTDWCSVMAHKDAYTSLSVAGDPNLIVYPDLGQKAWQIVLQAAELAYSGTAQDPVDGATHYFSTDIAPPKFALAADSIFVRQIDRMRFFKAF